MKELHVADITPINRADAYSANAYHVTDKATQPDVIGYAVAAATEALRVYSGCKFHLIGISSWRLLLEGTDSESNSIESHLGGIHFYWNREYPRNR